MITEHAVPPALRERDLDALPPDASTLETDRLFRLLADYRRRHLLTYLSRNEGWTPLATVADYIVTRELGLRPGLVPDERKRLYLTLFHTHVPMLVEPGLVSYDRERDRVRATPEIERVAPFLALTY